VLLEGLAIQPEALVAVSPANTEGPGGRPLKCDGIDARHPAVRCSHYMHICDNDGYVLISILVEAVEEPLVPVPTPLGKSYSMRTVL